MEYKIQIYMKKFIAFMAILILFINGRCDPKGELVDVKSRGE